MSVRKTLTALIVLSSASLAIGQGGGQSSSDLEGLTKRVDEFYCHTKAKRYERAYEMWVAAHRANPKEMKEHVRYARRMARGIKIEDWTISAIETSAGVARVTVGLRARVRDDGVIGVNYFFRSATITLAASAFELDSGGDSPSPG